MLPWWGMTLTAHYIVMVLHFRIELHGLQKGFRWRSGVFGVILGIRHSKDEHHCSANEKTEGQERSGFSQSHREVEATLAGTHMWSHQGRAAPPSGRPCFFPDSVSRGRPSPLPAPSSRVGPHLQGTEEVAGGDSGVNGASAGRVETPLQGHISQINGGLLRLLGGAGWGRRPEKARILEAKSQKLRGCVCLPASHGC